MVVQPEDRRAPQEDKDRCDDALRISGRTFIDSWDHLEADRPAIRARKLGRIAAVVRLLERMGELLDEAYAVLARHQQEHARSEKDKVRAIGRRGRAQRDDYEERARADIAALERAAEEAEAAGNPGKAKIHRIQAATIRDTRLRARWVNPVVIGLVGLLAGVVATQLLQDEVADFSSVLPWVVAVVAWALLDYFVEPRLRTWLADLQLKHMREEVALAFRLWNSLLVFEPAPGQNHPLPAWSDLGEYTDGPAAAPLVTSIF